MIASSSPVSALESSSAPVTTGSPARRIARERGHPLQDREPVAPRRHRAEVAVRAARRGRPSPASPTRRRRGARTRRACARSPPRAGRPRSTASASKTGIAGTAGRLDSPRWRRTAGASHPARGSRSSPARPRRPRPPRSSPRSSSSSPTPRRPPPTAARPSSALAARRARGGHLGPPGERGGLGLHSPARHAKPDRTSVAGRRERRPDEEERMAVVKIIELVGSSKTSTDDAAKQALTQASGLAAQHPRRRHRLDRDPRREPRRVPRPRAGRLPDRGHRRRLGAR